jgi:hypothetical protein
VNSSAELVALVPPDVAIVMSTVPALPAGEVAEMLEPSTLTEIPVAGLPPKATAVAPLKFSPWMVTAVPPARGPADGDTPVTIGAELKVN